MGGKGIFPACECSTGPITIYLSANFPPKSRYLSCEIPGSGPDIAPSKVPFYGKQMIRTAIRRGICGAVQHTVVFLP